VTTDGGTAGEAAACGDELGAGASRTIVVVVVVTAVVVLLAELDEGADTLVGGADVDVDGAVVVVTESA
jgi:hypothetical protein